MIPSETIEQVTSWAINLPIAVVTWIRIKIKIKRLFFSSPVKKTVSPSITIVTTNDEDNVVATHDLPAPASSKAVASALAPASSVEDGGADGGGIRNKQRRRSSMTVDIKTVNSQIGVVIAAKEMGEDVSYILAAAMILPVTQIYVIYSSRYTFDQLRNPTYTDIAICLFGFTLVYEHALSVLGAYLLYKQGVHVEASNIPLFNDCNTYGATRTNWRTVIMMIGTFSNYIMLVAAAAC